MNAIVYTKYGPSDVLELQEVEKPAPKDNQVPVKVHAASANALDWRPFTLTPMLVCLIRGGLLKPKDTSLGKQEFSQGKRSSFMGPLAAWAHFQSRLPNPSGQK